MCLKFETGKNYLQRVPASSDGECPQYEGVVLYAQHGQDDTMTSLTLCIYLN